MKSTEKAVLERIKSLEGAINKGQEYLESGAHADWTGFHPLFAKKMREGKALQPHRDWVKNVFLPRRERALGEAERLLERLAQQEARRGWQEACKVRRAADAMQRSGVQEE